MPIDRTARPRPPTRPAGLLPDRRLIGRSPGAGGPLPLLLGSVLVVAAVAVFVSGLDTGRATFGFDAAGLAARWAEVATDPPVAGLDGAPPAPSEEGDGVDIAWEIPLGDALALHLRADPASSMLVEAAVIGDPAQAGAAPTVAAMEALVGATEPGLGHAARRALLEELGVESGAGGRAVRGATEYVYAADAGGSVGLSAAPSAD